MSLEIGLWVGVDARTVDPLPPCPLPEEFAIYPKLYLDSPAGGLGHGQNIRVVIAGTGLYDGVRHGIVLREDGHTAVAIRAVWSGYPLTNGSATVIGHA